MASELSQRPRVAPLLSETLAMRNDIEPGSRPCKASLPMTLEHLHAIRACEVSKAMEKIVYMKANVMTRLTYPYTSTWLYLGSMGGGSIC